VLRKLKICSITLETVGVGNELQSWSFQPRDKNATQFLVLENHCVEKDVQFLISFCRNAN
jgi:hypothetical protein